jgi:pimeloyl-ACP methyl ester carboxylesterase
VRLLERKKYVSSSPCMHNVTKLIHIHQVAITDYPAPTILETIRTNVTKNIPASVQCPVTVYGHQWGGDFGDEFAATHAHRYTRILAADCLWMPWEHENLARSMLHFLSDSADARIYVIAGFHTGRAKMASFFEETVPEVGLEIEDIYEMNAEGKRLAWARERDGGRENIGERKKWLVVARLRRRIAR